MNVEVILVAAGDGQRLKATQPKALVRLNAKPLVSYALKVFERSTKIRGIILVAHPRYLSHFRKLVLKGRFKKVTAVVPGGKTRSDSVACGLKSLAPDTDIVMVHDAARPFVTGEMIDRSLMAMHKNKAAITAVAVKSTIKSVDPKNLCVTKTIPRDTLWEVQTPQTFQKDVLLKAHANPSDGTITDDAMLMEKLGVRVKVVPGDYRNIKITTVEDLWVASALLKGSKERK